jgi:hypothetical protein
VLRRYQAVFPIIQTAHVHNAHPLFFQILPTWLVWILLKIVKHIILTEHAVSVAGQFLMLPGRADIVFLKYIIVTLIMIMELVTDVVIVITSLSMKLLALVELMVADNIILMEHAEAVGVKDSSLTIILHVFLELTIAARIILMALALVVIRTMS